MSVRFIQFLERGNFLATWKKSKVFARAAMGGKSAKTEVLPGFGKIEHGGSSGGGPGIRSCLPKIHRGGPVCNASMK